MKLVCTAFKTGSLLFFEKEVLISKNPTVNAAYVGAAMVPIAVSARCM